MQIVGWTALVVSWFAWAYPFIFRAPHNQQRQSITVIGPTRLGLLLEFAAIFMAFAFRLPAESPPGAARVLPALLLGPIAAYLSWTAVAHLGKQFRVHAGLYEDHELVCSGPYAIVRHPIYTSLLTMLLCTLLVLTPWEWAGLSLAIFVVGTEIRVHVEDQLLESRFGDDFRKYRSSVRAYVPFIR
ncbi:MAG TPA: isoprenylcysteine carboxylmethyltransferase family protein [Bryobacteraceae bacterium]|nr:isoprenylcysteine carboxylmethyltransferase family protein [Bryobacteraceae bacterium]